MDHNGRHKAGRSKVPPPVPRKKLKKQIFEAKQQKDYSASDSVYHVPIEQLQACEDLLRLPFLYDDLVLECVNTRYDAGIYYTWAGPTLVAVNPCRPVDHLYTTSEIQHHHNQVQNGVEERSAHVYSVAGVAQHRLQHHLGLINQAVLVSGESGSGKTESARYMLGYLTHIETSCSYFPKSPRKGVFRDRQPEDIQQKILASNPILEAFGNAATLRNHNSSRFGKLVRLQYGGGRLCGAEIDTYLLEKTRVTHQPEKERNFHIFYQVVSGVRDGVLKDLVIKREEKFAILSQETTASDSLRFQQTLHAFRQLQFPANHLKQIYQVILALLHLGNIQFKLTDERSNNWTVNRDNEASFEGLRMACMLLGVNEDCMVKSLTVHTINVSSAGKISVFHKPLERESQCAERRDALMQLLYQTLFLHIVSFINSKISTHRNMWSHFMGILDIYGFETFEKNSLEQLCINYANERLQQAFILRYLATEHEVLREEGFLEVDVPYTDNSSCVSVIDSSVSVFTILNEECQLRRDVKEIEACNRICNALEYSGLVSTPPYHRPTPGFVIKHYAGPVQYEAHGLLHKNKDEVPHEVSELLAGTNNNFIAKLISTQDHIDPEVGRRTTRKITTLSKFKSSLDSLMKTLSSCDMHYVRCIKPSMQGMTGHVDKAYMMQQLRACGVIETVCISQAGYPVRISYNDFITRYGEGHTVTDIITSCGEVAKSVLMSAVEENIDNLCRFGHSRVFLSESALHMLEKVREEKRNQAATSLQKYWRRHKCWKQFAVLKKASVVIQKNVRLWLTRNRYKKLQCACVIIQKYARQLIVRQHYLRLRKAAVTVQKYFRGWMARRKFLVLMQQAAVRPYSRLSHISMNSFGYYSMGTSMSTSISAYSLNPSLLDMSPEAAFGSMGALNLSAEILNAYASPEHHQRLLETEESGIETDTESISGDPGAHRPRRLRRRAQLQKLVHHRSRLHHTASDESLIDTPDRAVTCVEIREDETCKNKEELVEDIKDLEDRGNEEIFRTDINKHSSEDIRKERSQPCNASQKIRIATVMNLQEITNILKDCTPSEDLQIVLSMYTLSLFFRSGVLSYRRMPMVSVKFHTRPTCLPFSHHLPHTEQPRGLWEALP